jgi:hypothetical protein
VARSIAVFNDVQRRFVRRRRAELELEHGLHQGDEVAPFGQRHQVELGDGVGQRQVGEVEGHHVDRVRDELGCQGPEVGAFEVHDARVLAERPQQLPVPGLDRVDPARAVLEQHAREAAGRRPRVEGHAVVDDDPEGGQGGAELGLTAHGVLAPGQLGHDVGHRLGPPSLGHVRMVA